MQTDVPPSPCSSEHGRTSRKPSAGAMTSSSPPARARPLRLLRAGHGSPGEPMARPSTPSCLMRWAPNRKSSRSRPDGLIDEAALDAILAEGPALIAIQQVNNETGVIQPLDRIAQRIRAAGSLLLAIAPRARANCHYRTRTSLPPVPTSSAGRRVSGCLLVKDLATLAPVGGTGKGLSPRHAGRSERCRVCGGSRRPALRHGTASWPSGAA